MFFVFLNMGDTDQHNLTEIIFKCSKIMLAFYLPHCGCFSFIPFQLNQKGRKIDISVRNVDNIYNAPSSGQFFNFHIAVNTDNISELYCIMKCLFIVVKLEIPLRTWENFLSAGTAMSSDNVLCFELILSSLMEPVFLLWSQQGRIRCRIWFRFCPYFVPIRYPAIPVKPLLQNSSPFFCENMVLIWAIKWA